MIDRIFVNHSSDKIVGTKSTNQKTGRNSHTARKWLEKTIFIAPISILQTKLNDFQEKESIE